MVNSHMQIKFKEAAKTSLIVGAGANNEHDNDDSSDNSLEIKEDSSENDNKCI
jgi:hypothetical protein